MVPSRGEFKRADQVAANLRMNDNVYHTLRQRLAAMLKRDALLQTLGQHDKIGANFLETQSRLKSGGDQRYHKLIVAMNFWDAWIMARNMDWMEHEHLLEADWPRLAVAVAVDLAADRDISDPRVKAAFDLTSTLELPKHYGPNREACPLDGI